MNLKRQLEFHLLLIAQSSPVARFPVLLELQIYKEKTPWTQVILNMEGSCQKSREGSARRTNKTMPAFAVTRKAAIHGGVVQREMNARSTVLSSSLTLNTTKRQILTL